MNDLPQDHVSPLAAQVARRVSRRWPLVSAGVAVVLVAALAGILVFRPHEPFAIDAEWMAEVVEHRSPFWEVPALVMNSLGGGVVATFVIPLGIVIVLLIARRRWGALVYAISALVSAGTVQLLKHVVGRARPEEILVHADFGSFPSGHSANAVTTALALAVIFPRLWVWIAGGVYTVAMMLSRTYLGAHWLSDTIGGLLLGGAIVVIVWAPLADRLWAEDLARRRRT
jgi:membrane-associated phospholipid phosphatase